MKIKNVIVVLFLCGLAEVSGWAGTTMDPEAVQSIAPDTTAKASESIWTQDSLTGNWGGARDTLANYGVVISPVYTGEVLGNTTGGFRRSVIYEGLFNLGLDIDLSKLAKWEQGGNFHTNFVYVHGGGQGGGLSTNSIGDLNNTSNIAAYNSPRLQEAWYDQPFWGDKANLKAGLISFDSEFMISNSAGVFINSNFGAPAPVGSNLTNPGIYPLAAPGLRLFIQPCPQFTWQGGVFTGDSGAQSTYGGDRGNPNGLNAYWNNGALVANEIAFLWNQQPKDHGLPGTYKIGSLVHTGHYNSWDSQTANALNGSPLTDAGPNYFVYGVVDQTLYKKESQTIAVFTRGGVSPSDIDRLTAYMDGGFDFTGFIPGRDNDVGGVAFSHTWLGNHYSDSQLQTGAVTVAYSGESELEITYKIQLAPWWILQPDLQYILTPGGLQSASDALVLGLRTQVSF